MDIGQIAIKQSLAPIYGEDVALEIALTSPVSNSPKWRTLEQEISTAMKRGEDKLDMKISDTLRAIDRLEAEGETNSIRYRNLWETYEILTSLNFKIKYPD